MQEQMKMTGNFSQWNMYIESRTSFLKYYKYSVPATERLVGEHLYISLAAQDNPSERNALNS